MPRQRVAPINLLPRGLSTDEAAHYVGLGHSKFGELVARGLMPKPKRIDGRVIYDRYALDIAFSDLPEDRENSIDAALRKAATQRG